MMDIQNFMFTLFIVVCAALLIVFVLFFVTKSKDDTEESIKVVRHDIHQYRLKRYENIFQVLKAFGAGNPNTDALKKLADIYTRVKTEKDEIKWEEKYVPVMQAFMRYTLQNIPPQLQGSYDMANNAIIANERSLELARAELAKLSEKMTKYEQQPYRTLVKGGTIITHFVRRSDTVVKDLKASADELAERKAREQEEYEMMLEEARQLDREQQASKNEGE